MDRRRSSSLIRNYLGFAKGVSGSRLAEQAYEQASAFGASFVLMHRAIALARSGDGLRVSLADGREVSAGAVILATGATYRRLDVPSLEALARCRRLLRRPSSRRRTALSGKDAYIAGGGNSAGQAALHLARYARRVTLVVRAAIARGGNVALPGASDRGRAERRGAHRHRGGRRGRRGPPAAAGPARAQPPTRKRRSPPTLSSC